MELNVPIESSLVHMTGTHQTKVQHQNKSDAALRERIRIYFFFALRLAQAAFNFAESLAFAAGLILRFFLRPFVGLSGVEEPRSFASRFSSDWICSLSDAACRS